MNNDFEVTLHRKFFILAVVHDLTSKFLYYDRVGDVDLPVGMIEDMIMEGNLSISEIVNEFETQLRSKISDKMNSKKY